MSPAFPLKQEMGLIGLIHFIPVSSQSPTFLALSTLSLSIFSRTLCLEWRQEESRSGTDKANIDSFLSSYPTCPPGCYLFGLFPPALLRGPAHLIFLQPLPGR